MPENIIDEQLIISKYAASKYIIEIKKGISYQGNANQSGY